MLEKIENFIKQYGWAYKIEEDGKLLTGFTDSDGNGYPLLISLKDELVSLTTSFQLESEKTQDNSEWAILLLRFNYAWPMVKMGLDDDFTLVLSLDLLSSELSFEGFSFCLDVFVETAQMLTRELAEMIKAK